MSAETINLIPGLFIGPDKDFKTHLEIEDNDRILFSGIYGIGKTTFLNHYFSRPETLEKYTPIFLYPVNYSVLSNEDIFEYVKYDILYELIVTLNQEISIGDLSKTEKWLAYFNLKVDEILLKVVEVVPKLGKSLQAILGTLASIDKEFTEFDERATKGELGDVEKFLNKIVHKSPGLYEVDLITEIIRDTIEKMKTNNIDGKQKQVVLIIDDLDRIDPHHIFRLFNIFAAHFDRRYNGTELKNKFGFDKVIFVCDLNNIRGIFKTNYGTNVDFNGYIDKFYSKKVFEFNNRRAIRDIIENIVSNLNTSIFSNKSNPEILNYFKLSKDILVNIFTHLFNTSSINLRSLLKYKEKIINSELKTVNFKSTLKISTWQLYPLIFFDILYEHYGNFTQMRESLMKCAELYTPSSEKSHEDRSLIGMLVFMLNLEKGTIFYMNERDKPINSWMWEEEKITITYVVRPNYISESPIYYTAVEPEDYDLSSVNIFKLLVKVADILYRLGFFS